MKTRQSKIWLSLGIGLASLSPVLVSCGKSNPTNVDRLAATTVDRALEEQVLKDLHMSNQEEIAAGNLAQQQASNQEVKDLAKQVVTDHTQADQQVTQAAQRLNINLGGGASRDNAPPAPGAPAQPAQPSQPATPNNPAAPGGNTSPGNTGGDGGGMVDMLRNLRGQQFDQEFLAMMAESHGETLAALQGVQQQLGDSETGKLVKQLVPVIQSHLDKAKQIQQRLGFNAESSHKGKGVKGQQGTKGQQQQTPNVPPVRPMPPKQQQQSPVPPVTPVTPVTPQQPKPPVTPVQPQKPQQPSTPSKPVTPKVPQQGQQQLPEQGQRGGGGQARVGG